MGKEIIPFPNRERLWVEKNSEIFEDIIREEFRKYDIREEVLNKKGIAPGSTAFFKNVLKQVLDREKQHDFDFEKLFQESIDELKRIFYNINKEYKIKLDLQKPFHKSGPSENINMGEKNKDDLRGAYIEKSIPSGDL